MVQLRESSIELTDLFLIWFLLGLQIELRPFRPCHRLRLAVAANHVSWRSHTNANTANHTTQRHTVGPGTVIT